MNLSRRSRVRLSLARLVLAGSTITPESVGCERSTLRDAAKRLGLVRVSPFARKSYYVPMGSTTWARDIVWLHETRRQRELASKREYIRNRKTQLRNVA